MVIQGYNITNRFNILFPLVTILFMHMIIKISYGRYLYFGGVMYSEGNILDKTNCY